MKKGAPPCGLYLRIDPGMDMQDALKGVRQVAMVVNRSEYERNMHVIEIKDDDRDRAAILLELARQVGLTAIFAGPARTAFALKAEGVMLAAESEIGAARTLMGEQAILGLACGADYALAERAVAAGADYVEIVGPSPVFARWSTAKAAPALAGPYIDNDAAGAFVEAGASFLECSRYVWDHPKGVLQGVVNMLHAIDLAADRVGPN